MITADNKRKLPANNQNLERDLLKEIASCFLSLFGRFTNFVFVLIKRHFRKSDTLNVSIAPGKPCSALYSCFDSLKENTICRFWFCNCFIKMNTKPRSPAMFKMQALR